MFKFFKTKRSTAVNVAQLLLLVFFIPLAFFILKLCDPEFGKTKAMDLVLAFISQIPMLDVALSVLKDYALFDLGSVGSVTFSVLLKAFPDAVFVAVVVHTLNSFFVHMWRKENLRVGEPSLFVKPMTILPTFVGIFLSTLVLMFLSRLGDITAIVSELIIIFIMIFGFRLLFKSVFGGRRLFSLDKILLLVIDGLYAIICTCYITILVAVTVAKSVTTVGEALKFVLPALVVVVLATFVVFGLRHVVDKYIIR